MTVLDFRSGGYVDSRDNYAAPESDAAHANYWHSHHVGPQSQDWGEDEAWDEARYATQAGARLRDREGVLGRVARLTHYLGALVSVGLMVALMVWGYQLVVRDVSGVPVIRAAQGDMRVAPSEPGGELTDRTGLAVNEVAAGAQPATVDSVAIAPAPTALTGQDVAMGELGATAQEPSVASDEPVAAPGEAAVAMTDADAARLAEAGVPAVAPGLADAVSASSALTDASGQPVQDLAITAALTEAGAVPAVTTTTRPMRRPQRIAAASSAPVANDADPVPLVAEAEPVAAPVETPAPAPVQSATVASGAPLVQIGAFDSGSIAESEWSRISGRYGDLFAGKAPVVQEHKAGGRTFYRLRIAGFDNRDDARKFCAALIEAGTDCIPAAAN